MLFQFVQCLYLRSSQWGSKLHNNNTNKNKKERKSSMNGLKVIGSDALIFIGNGTSNKIMEFKQFSLESQRKECWETSIRIQFI